MKQFICSIRAALIVFWQGSPRPCPAPPQSAADWYARARVIVERSPAPGSFLWRVHDALVAKAHEYEQLQQNSPH